MKAIVYEKYGPPEVLEIRELAKPEPKSNEVLIKINATVVTSGDSRMRSLNLSGVPFIQRILARLILGVRKPRNPIPGLWLSGEIEATGRYVTKLRVGEKVVARTSDFRFGASAEYVCLPEKSLIAPMPSNLSFEEAVAVPFGGLTALCFLRENSLKSGMNILIYGASGAVGSAAVQIAQYFGAVVTGVCSTSNLEMVRSLGAFKVIDYTKEDFAKPNELYDLVFDAVGKITHERAKNILKPSGRYVSVVTSGHVKESQDDLIFLKDLVEAGKFIPVIDRYYTLEQIVEAHRYVDEGHKKGNVVITVGHS